MLNALGLPWFQYPPRLSLTPREDGLQLSVATWSLVDMDIVQMHRPHQRRPAGPCTRVTTHGRLHDIQLQS